MQTLIKKVVLESSDPDLTPKHHVNLYRADLESFAFFTPEEQAIIIMQMTQFLLQLKSEMHVIPKPPAIADRSMTAMKKLVQA